MRKTLKYFMPLILLLVLAISIFIIARLKYKSFEGKIEDVTVESYQINDPGFYLPSSSIVFYHVKRIFVRTKKSKILDFCIYGSSLDEKSVGKFIKGSYKPGNILEINGKNVILGFIDFPGPKIELKGKPIGVIKKYRIISD